MSKNNNHYSSGLGTVLTMIGVAVGLGNVWRFPYMMGSYGGSAFLLIYIVLTLLFAFPALVSEMALGQVSRTGTLTSFESLFGNRIGKKIGYFLLGVVTIAGSYYAVVVANVWYSTAFSASIGFCSENNESYQELLSNGYIQYLFTVTLVLGALFVSYLGLKDGIERISKIIMPLFIIAILYMIYYTWSLPGAISKVKHFLSPDFALIGPTEIFAALGQAFFSIGLGGTFVVVYAGFIRKEQNIFGVAILTCLGDLGSSLLISLFLIPSILVFGLEMNAGPSLIFNTLPELFAAIPGGRLIGTLFLLALSLVAFLSLIAAFHVPISSLSGGTIPKKKLVIGFGILQLFLTLPSAFFPQILGTLDLVFGSGMQLLGSMLAVGGIWFGIEKGYYRDLLFHNPDGSFAKISVFWLRWIVPGTLLAVLIGYIHNNL